MPGQNRFRSFVTDMKKDFPTFDEMVLNQEKEKSKKLMTVSPIRKPTVSRKLADLKPIKFEAVEEILSLDQIN